VSGSNRGHFLSGLAGVMVGIVVMAAIPAVATNGDYMIVGEKNNAQRATKLISKGGLVLNVGKAGNPALTINVVGDTPPLQVNSSSLVANLNADLLDGMEAGAFARAEDVHPFILVLPPGYTTTPAYVSNLMLEWQCLADGTALLIWRHSPGGDWYLGGVQQVSNEVVIVELAYGQKAILGVDVPISSLTATTSLHTAIMLAPGGVFSNGPGYVGATCLGHGVVFTQDYS